MKKTILVVLFSCLCPIVSGAVTANIYLADGNTPLEYWQIMVGTRLTIIINSDSAEYWYGGKLVVPPEMQGKGVLFGRGSDGYGEYPGSILPATGEFDPFVLATVFPGIGFEFYGGEEPIAGDWFIFDYNAVGIGDCNVAFYDFDMGTSPVDVLPFTHVRTRDFEPDDKVDFADFAIISSYWQQPCSGPVDCEGTDLDESGTVDVNDMMLFFDYWLEQTQ